jgi:hypothetical protein
VDGISTDLIQRSALLGARLEGWPPPRPRLWRSFETRASKSAVADFDTVGCQSQAGLTLVRAPPDEADEWCRYESNFKNAPLARRFEFQPVAWKVGLAGIHQAVA